ncbi:hypothetical protein ACFQU2_38385 [Siccirubricoccus deserti]
MASKPGIEGGWDDGGNAGRSAPQRIAAPWSGVILGAGLAAALAGAARAEAPPPLQLELNRLEPMAGTAEGCRIWLVLGNDAEGRRRSARCASTW